MAATVGEAVQRLMTQVAAGRVSVRENGKGFYVPAPTLENIRKFKSGLPKKPA